MSNLANRLGKLEAKLGIGRQPARMIVLEGGEGRAGEIDAFLDGQGIRRTVADDLVVFINRYERRDGSLEPPVPLKLISINPLARGRRGN